MCPTVGFMGMYKLRPALTKSVGQVLRDGWARKKKERKTRKYKEESSYTIRGDEAIAIQAYIGYG